ncbi:MAG: hypothetical protein P4M06_18350 [Pandoraea sp.]|nr:hypothetical protein [Pandoraea sp.]MDR3399511.1 hypothetical protein [Pandoraea sp.]
MLYPRTLRNVGVALALATFAMFSASAFAAAPHTPSGHHAKTHASSSKHRHHGTATKPAVKASAHKKAHAHKPLHGKKKTVKAHHTTPPKTTHRTRPTVASQRHRHSHA